MEYSVSTLKTNTIQAATGTTVNLASGQVFTAPGHVIQTVTVASTSNGSTTSSSYAAATGLSASITPSSTSSKILVLVNSSAFTSSSNTEGAYTIYRGVSNIGDANGISRAYAGNSDAIYPLSMHILDSPSSTSSVTYAVYMKRTQGSGTVQNNLRGCTQSITLQEIAQ